MAFLTYGRLTSDGVEAHDDYPTECPFLGGPNEQASGGPATLLASDTSA
jgi:hypothetical protein